MKTWVTGLLLLLLAPLAHASPADLDLHQYWDQRCQECHGHSSEFARRYLHVENGRLVGVHHGNDLDVFLRHHYLANDLVEPVSAMLMAQLATPPLFSRKCAGCHDTAAAFARKSLAIRGGALVGKASGRKVADFLSSHGGLTPDEVPIVVDSLKRVLDEVSPSGQ